MAEKREPEDAAIRAGRRSDDDPFERHSGKSGQPAAAGDPRVVAYGEAQPEGLTARGAAPEGPPAPFGDTGLSVSVSGAERPGQALLVVPFDASALKGIDLPSVRLFQVSDAGVTPVWQSGVNASLGFVWAKLPGSGTYRAIGLPRDLLLREAVRDMARRRGYSPGASSEDNARITADALAMFREAPVREFQEFRRLLTLAEVQSGPRRFSEVELQRGEGFHLAPFPLPGGRTLAEFRQLLTGLETPDSGFPEEELFFDPGALEDPQPPWPEAGSFPFPFPFPGWTWPWPGGLPVWLESWSESKDWWMYHHDNHHTGRATGGSPIRSTTVGSLTLRHAVPVSGEIITIPSIVHGKVYVGTAQGTTGYLYKIDLATGAIDHTFPVPTRSPSSYYQGVGGSPTVVGGRVYFSALPGWVFCLDAHTLTQVWSLDLRVASAASNQPVNNPQAECWSSPLVVGDHVYIGCGEGEAGAWGFVYCIHADSGRVTWLFSTDKFATGTHNNPNVVPASAALSPLPAGFSTTPDPTVTGVHVWSSLAYDHEHDRLWMGTGNAYPGNTPAPDEDCGSGVLALDANTGAFVGFIPQTPADCYRSDDQDVDVCGSPTVFRHKDKLMVAIGAKSGAFWVIDSAAHAVHARRNVLPYYHNNPLQPIPTVDVHPGGGENMYGIFGTPAVDREGRRLYVCVGGYVPADGLTTPFVRALHSDTLDDAWPGAFGPDAVWRYTAAAPPLYTSGECGLGSPTVVNDVVLVPTNKPALYAIDADTGLCLWSASGLIGQWVFGPAVSGKHMVVGCGSTLQIYAT